MKIDKNDAPKGAIAVDAKNICDGCMYTVHHGVCSKPVGVCFCTALQRRDGHDVIFRPAPKSYNRDAHGRFTSEQTEKTKQLKEYAKHMMRVASTGIDLPPRGFGKTETTTQILESAIRHTPYAEVKKAMTGETITRTLGKKQVEIGRNREFYYAKSIAVSLHEKHFQECTEWEPCADTLGILTQIDNMTTGWKCEIENSAKHVQTNAEKYASKSVELTLFRAKEDLSATFTTVSELMEWLNQPAAQGWPDWCKVGAWIVNFSWKEPIFRKIKSISANQLHFADGWDIEFEHVSKNYKPARVRSFTAKEAVDLVGKTIIGESGRSVKIEVIEICKDKKVNIVIPNGNRWAPEFVALYYSFPDGSPCGVLEVIK